MPGEVIDAITRRGLPVHVIAIAQETDAATFADFPGARLSWSKYGAALASLKAAGVRDVIMVGRMTRPRLRDARPDFGFIKGLGSALKVIRAGGDDALLRAVVQLFEPHGFRVVGVNDVAPELLIAEGLSAGPEPSLDDRDDIALGMRLIDALGRFDIGQAAIVAGGRVLAIEGAEGTDKTIGRVTAHRAHAHAHVHRPAADARRGVLVKRPKPQQDLRVDLPTIGPDTVSAVLAAGLVGIAAEAGWVIAAQRAELFARASAAQIFVVGVARAASIENQSDRSALAQSALTGPLRDTPQAWQRDVTLGCDVIATLASFDIAASLVVRQSRVISIGVNETPNAVLARTYPARRGLFRGRSGAMIIDQTCALDDALFGAIAKVGLAVCIVIDRRSVSERDGTGAGESAARFGIVLQRVSATALEA